MGEKHENWEDRLFDIFLLRNKRIYTLWISRPHAEKSQILVFLTVKPLDLFSRIQASAFVWRGRSLQGPLFSVRVHPCHIQAWEQGNAKVGWSLADYAFLTWPSGQPSCGVGAVTEGHRFAALGGRPEIEWIVWGDFLKFRDWALDSSAAGAVGLLCLCKGPGEIQIRPYCPHLPNALPPSTEPAGMECPLGKPHAEYLGVLCWRSKAWDLSLDILFIVLNIVHFPNLIFYPRNNKQKRYSK